MKTEVRLRHIEIRNPENLSLEELQLVQKMIYEIPPLDLIKEEGYEVKKYLTRVNQEIAKRCYN